MVSRMIDLGCWGLSKGVGGLRMEGALCIQRDDGIVHGLARLRKSNGVKGCKHIQHCGIL